MVRNRAKKIQCGSGRRWLPAATLLVGSGLLVSITPARAGNPPDICQVNPCSSGCPLEGTLCCQYGAACCGTPDCNGNGMKDSCDLQYGFSRDCDEDGELDECDDSVDCVYAEFVYDALGRRIAKVDHAPGGDVTTRYYYDGQNVIEETDQSENLKRYFVNGTQYIDERVLVHNTGTPDTEHYYLERELHTVSGLASASGAYAEWYAYGAYGDVKVRDASNKLLPKSAVGNPYYFTGRELDFAQPSATSTGNPPVQVYHYRARSYDAVNGRFLQRDPYPYVDGMDLYSYVRENPLALVDPHGEFVLQLVLGVAGAGWEAYSIYKTSGTAGFTVSGYARIAMAGVSTAMMGGACKAVFTAARACAGIGTLTCRIETLKIVSRTMGTQAGSGLGKVIAKEVTLTTARATITAEADNGIVQAVIGIAAAATKETIKYVGKDDAAAVAKDLPGVWRNVKTIKSAQRRTLSFEFRDGELTTRETIENEYMEEPPSEVPPQHPTDRPLPWK